MAGVVIAQSENGAVALASALVGVLAGTVAVVAGHFPMFPAIPVTVACSVVGNMLLSGGFELRSTEAELQLWRRDRLRKRVEWSTIAEATWHEGSGFVSLSGPRPTGVIVKQVEGSARPRRHRLVRVQLVTRSSRRRALSVWQDVSAERLPLIPST